MSDYATNSVWGGQRASLGRVVLIKQRDGVLMPADVVEIDQMFDLPVLRPKDGSAATDSLRYHHAETEDDLLRMPLDTWCWPPKVA